MLIDELNGAGEGGTPLQSVAVASPVWLWHVGLACGVNVSMDKFHGPSHEAPEIRDRNRSPQDLQEPLTFCIFPSTLRPTPTVAMRSKLSEVLRRPWKCLQSPLANATFSPFRCMNVRSLTKVHQLHQFRLCMDDAQQI